MAPDKELVIECVAIIIILAIAAYMFIRSRRKVWAGSVLPLMLVPFLNIIYEPIDIKIKAHSVINSYYVRIALYAAAFIIVCIWVLKWSKKLPSGKSKYAYSIIAILFTFFLILIFLRNMVLRPFLGIF